MFLIVSLDCKQTWVNYIEKVPFKLQLLRLGVAPQNPSFSVHVRGGVDMQLFPDPLHTRIVQ